jgi:hypothetical protein
MRDPYNNTDMYNNRLKTFVLGKCSYYFITFEGISVYKCSPESKSRVFFAGFSNRRGGFLVFFRWL